jgi:hypothetical protein
MKKRITSLINILLFVIVIIAQESSDRDTYEFKGPVRSVIYEEAKYEKRSGKLVEGARKISTKFAFDVSGYFIEDVRYIGDGRKHVINYDRGKSSTDTVYAADGSIESKEVTTLDERRRVSEVAYFDGRGALAHRRVYRYEAMRLVGIDTYSADMSLQEKEIYVYNSKGLIAVEHYDGDGTLLGRQAYDADFKEGKSESLSYGADGTYLGKTVSPIFTDEGENKGSERIYYNADGSLERRDSLTYNEGGRIVERAGFKADGTLEYKWRAVYEFDSRGNWTKETKQTWVTKNGKSFFEPMLVTYRTITYY